MKIIVAITGASGALYAQRLLDNLDPNQHDLHVVTTSYGQAVIAHLTQLVPEYRPLPELAAVAAQALNKRAPRPAAAESYAQGAA